MAHAKSDDAAIADLQAQVARIPDDLKATIPEGMTIIMSPQVLLTRIHAIATILTVALAPGTAMSLFNALRTQPTVPYGLLMGTFAALLSVSLCTWALIRDQRRNTRLVKKAIRDRSADVHDRALRATTTNVDEVIREAMIETGEMDARVEANAKLAKDIAALQPAKECAEDERQARIDAAKAEIAALVREQDQALVARITALEQSVLRGSGQS
jgi:polyhydroxyalkanoate synthesis regulator phasin